MNTNAKTELKRAYLMIEWGRLDDALAACEDAAKAAPGHPLPYALAGSFLSAFGRHGDALKQLRKALRVAPDDPFANLCFAETSLMLGRTGPARRALDRLRNGDALDAGGFSKWADGLAQLESELAEMTPLVVAR
jgi:predicted Zn-dependent protease